MKKGPAGAGHTAAWLPLVVMLNWQEALKRLVPNN
jgi:hypothetical protein